MIKRYNQFVKGKINEEFDMSPEIETPSTLEVGSQFSGEEEEEEVDKYQLALKSLADAAGVDFNPGDKSVIINGKEVTFPAETEKYHIKGIKKGFATLEDVIAQLEGGKSEIPSTIRQEVRDEISSIKDEEVLDPIEQFESKSYKSKRYKK